MAIVIVDDEAWVRESTKRLLENAGLKVLGEATDGGEALALVEVVKPEVVLMDGHMPVMDGPTATRYLAALHPDLRVVAHTADPTLDRSFSRAGAAAIVYKGSGEVVDVVRRALQPSDFAFAPGQRKL